MPSRLNAGACADTSTVASTPNVRAARATPRPWFPADAAITLRRPPGSSASAASRAAAPRSLNEPVRCRFSSFSQTSAPVRRPSDGAGTSGVTRASRRTRFATSPPVTSRQTSGSNIRCMCCWRNPITSRCGSSGRSTAGARRARNNADVVRGARPAGSTRASARGRGAARRRAVGRDSGGSSARSAPSFRPTTTRCPRCRPSPTSSVTASSWQ